MDKLMIKKCKYMGQEMESYPIIIRACAHYKDHSKQNEDT